MEEEKTEIDKIKEMLTPEEVQVYVNKMTNWRRNQWARAGYSIHEEDLVKFVGLVR